MPSLRCTQDDLNGTDIEGKIVLCATQHSPTTKGPFAYLSDARQNVVNGGGTGLIFVQYTTDILEESDGFPYVLVDIDTGKKIKKYIDSARYTTSWILISTYNNAHNKLDQFFLYHELSLSPVKFWSFQAAHRWRRLNQPAPVQVAC